MTPLDAWALALVIGIGLYLVVALLIPEKFQ